MLISSVVLSAAKHECVVLFVSFVGILLTRHSCVCQRWVCSCCCSERFLLTLLALPRRERSLVGSCAHHLEEKLMILSNSQAAEAPHQTLSSTFCNCGPWQLCLRSWERFHPVLNIYGQRNSSSTLPRLHRFGLNWKFNNGCMATAVHVWLKTDGWIEICGQI